MILLEVPMVRIGTVRLVREPEEVLLVAVGVGLPELRLGLHLLGEQADTAPAERTRDVAARGPVGETEVHLHDVGQVHEHAGQVGGDHVVEGHGVAGRLQAAARLEDLRVRGDVLEHLHHQAFARQARRVALEQGVAGEVDEGPPPAGERLEPDHVEGGVDDLQGRPVRVRGVVARVRAAAIQQLVRARPARPIEDRLARDEDGHWTQSLPLLHRQVGPET